MSTIIKYFAMILLGLPFMAGGQSLSPTVISTTGHFGSSANASLSATTGELMVATFSSPNHFFTQGFQQPLSTDTSTSIEHALAKGKVKLYPNPVTKTLTVEVTTPHNRPYQVQIWNTHGQVMDLPRQSREGPENRHYQINFTGVPPGLYLVRLFSQKQSKVFKVQKAGY